MAAAGVVAFKFIIDLRRCLQLFLQAVGSHEGGRTVHFIKFSDFIRYIDVCIRIIQFLLYQFITENMPQFFKGHGLQSAGIQKRSRFIFHIGPHVIPLLGHLRFFQIDFVGNFFVRHNFLLLF